MSSVKKTYTAPELRNWGNVVDLTQVGRTNPGGDADWGSVIPPTPPDVTPGKP